MSHSAAAGKEKKGGITGSVELHGKKQAFNITDTGEFVDNVYRVNTPNALYGKIIGRNVHESNVKRPFTAADISCEGYMFKRGSWFKSWKKRYFVLRRDIHSLCYFASKDSLTLIGAFQLGSDTLVSGVQPDAVDGADNVLMVRLNPEEEDLDKAVLIQADSVADEMRWMKAIAQEVNTMRDINVDDSGSYTNWWSKLFDRRNEVGASIDRRKSVNVKGENPIASARDLNPIASANKVTELSLDFVFGGVESSFGDSKAKNAVANDEDSDSDESSDDEHDGRSSTASTASTASSVALEVSYEKSLANQSNKVMSALEEDEDEDPEGDPDDEDKVSDMASANGGASQTDAVNALQSIRLSTTPVTASSDLPSPPAKKPSDSPPTSPRMMQPGEMESSHLAFTTSKEASMRLKESKKRKKAKGLVSEKKIAKENKGKPVGRPPFSVRHIDNYKMGDEIGGFQMNLRIENICNHNDKIAMVVWSYLPLKPKKDVESSRKSALEDSDGDMSPRKSLTQRVSDLFDAGASSKDQHGAAAMGVKPGDKVVNAEEDKVYGWVQTSKTEVVTITDQPEDGQDIIAEQLVQFSLLQEAFPHKCEIMMVELYKMDHNAAAPSGSATGLGSYIVSSCIIMRNALENSKVFTIPMRVAQPFQVDNGVSDGLHPSVTLGIAKVSTPAIKSQREYMRKALAVKPYHEVMYSFDTIYGRTVSMEQIFASGYPLAVAGALSNMYYHERSPIVAQLMKLIEQELEDSGALEPEKPQRRASRVVEVVETGAWAPSTPRDSRPRASTDTGDDDGMGMSKYAEEQKNKALSAVDDVNLIMLEGLREVRDHCVLVNSGGDIPNRVLSIEEGGLNLRRSVMRFTPKWQFFTTNLNVHMMSSQTLPFAAFKNGEDASVLFGKDQPYEECYDVGCSGIPGKDSEAAAATMAESGTSSPKVARTPTRNSGDSEESKTTTPNNFNVFGVNPGAWKGSRATHLVPTLTLGCPAAHCLKFEDGGLRRMFKGMSDFNRLMWMQALQSNLPTQSLVSMFQEYPEESHALFGNLATTEMLCTTSGLAKVTRRRYQLAYRIDMCGSQALGFALTAVRMSVVQATNFGHSCWEALARSLKIGFFMCFQSMLSTKGDELGMLEDLEVAALWLSLVSLRLVIDPSLDVPENTSEAAKGMKASIGVVGDLPGTPLNNSKTVPPPPIKLRRDLNGRIIADLYVSAKEANTIRACLASIAEYEIPTYSVYKEPPKKARNLNTDAKSTKVGSVPGGFDAADFQIGGPTNTRNEDENDAKKALRFSTTPSVLYEPNEQEPKVLAVLPICAVVFTQGVNEMQTIANMTSSSDVNHQVQINQEALKRVKEFHAHYRSILYTQLEMKETMLKEKQEAAKALEAKNQAKGHNAVMSANGLNTTAPRGKGNAGARVSTLAKTFGGMKKAEDGASKGGMMSTLSKTFGRRTNLAKTERKIEAPPAPSPAAVAMANSARALEELISAVRFSAQTPSDKHCHVLLAISRLTREMGGSVGILCKSGKDRTSQGVTLEIARGLVEDLGVTGGMDKCHSLRTFGTRRMNVYANTGQSMYAFNSLQRLALPTCYRPPANTCSGKVNS